MAIMNMTEKKRACVTGGTGYIAGMLVKQLLLNGYAVNTTVRNSGNQKRISYLLDLQCYGELNIFQADLTIEGSFDDAVAGCDIVFHVATPVNFESQDPENDMVKPAIEGTLSLLRSVKKAQTVKRVVWTSSIAAMSVTKMKQEGHVINEGCWADVDYLTSEKPSPTWGYPVSKVLAEKAAWKFAEENMIDLVTIFPAITAGTSITPDVPISISLAMSLLTGSNDFLNGMKGLEMESGVLPFAHVEDIVNAHIFVAEKESASGRYVCSNINTTLPELAKFLENRYPEYNITTDFGEYDPNEPKQSVSSEKLIKEGFRFKYGLEEIYDHSLDYLKTTTSWDDLSIISS